MSALIWLAYASLLVLGLLDNFRGPFFPDILADIHLNGTQGSLFFATTSLLAFTGSWLSHRVVRWRSSVFLMTAALLISAIGYVWITRAHTIFALLPACALFGLGYGALNVAQNVMVFEGAPPSHRRRIFAGLQSMYALAAFSAPLIASLFRWLGLEWRASFFILAALPLLLSVFSVRLKSPRPHAEAKPVPRLVRAEWIACAFFSLMIAGYLWGEISISTRIVQWLRADLNYSPDRADLFLAMFSFMLFVGRLLFSLMHFPRVDNWLILLCSSGFAALFYLLTLCFSPWWIAGVGLAMAPFYPIAMEQISHSFQRKSAEALGVVIAAGSLSIVAMQICVGALSDVLGVGSSLFVGPICLTLLTIGLLIHRLQVVRLRSR